MEFNDQNELTSKNRDRLRESRLTAVERGAGERMEEMSKKQKKRKNSWTRTQCGDCGGEGSEGRWRRVWGE